ncbi:uncharacterized LOC100283747 [Zea mays]|jgi:hypothetical protein|uniref:Ocs element-binding factor 1 n=1 Tax=Zea mays TaxID=4577 RepID=B6TLC2_MAIZE|eukprot:NP_001150118.1 ocs element-binding factor 1 [Zea mays]
MQQSCAAANLARLPLPVVPGLEDLASLFLPRNGPVLPAHDYSSSFDFDVVAGLDPAYYYYPHSCDGGAAIATPVSSVSAERKRRRLASNRSSARRSRARRQRRLHELSLRAAELLGANQRLLVDLNRVVARHGAVARENARLREEAAGLRTRLGEVEVGEAAAAAAAGQGPLRGPS